MSDVKDLGNGTSVLKDGPFIRATYFDGCAYCDEEKAKKSSFFPHHIASARCRSGRRNHCTCSVCW